jgi:hypothetical protein
MYEKKPNLISPGKIKINLNGTYKIRQMGQEVNGGIAIK